MSEIVGERIPTIVVSVTAETAPSRTARLLDLDRGAAVLVRDHTYLDVRDAAILCGRSVFRGDVRLDYVLGKVPTGIPGD
jgi:GntR family transcriptional regulator